MSHLTKSTLPFLLATLTSLASWAADSPRYKASVICFNGKLDSGSSCSATTFQPDGRINETGKMTCGHPGKVSEIVWTFVGRHGDKDVYRFTRRFPADRPDVTTTSKKVEFSDQRVVVFEDANQVVVIQPPLPAAASSVQQRQ